MVLQYDEPRQLSVSHFSPMSGQEDAPESYHTIVYTLVEDDGGTRLSLSQDNNASEQEAEQSTKTWQQMLAALKHHVEGSDE